MSKQKKNCFYKVIEVKNTDINIVTCVNYVIKYIRQY